MKKPFIYIILLISLIGCNSQKTISIESPEKLKKNQLIGTFVGVSKKIDKRKEDRITEYFFRIEEKKYFIKFNEGFVSKEEVIRYLDQKVVIKGEIKNGEWEDPISGSLNSLEPSRKPRKGDYIVINRIYK